MCLFSINEIINGLHDTRDFLDKETFVKREAKFEEAPRAVILDGIKGNLMVECYKPDFISQFVKIYNIPTITKYIFHLFVSLNILFR